MLVNEVSAVFFEKLTQLLGNVFRPKPRYITVTPVAALPQSPALPPARLPRHVAIIMDGNGRWAAQRKLPRSAGHAAGTEALREIIRASDDLDIEALSLYAFSTENWARSKEEVDALMGLLLQYFNSEIDELDEKNVRITILGDVDGLPEKQREAVMNAMRRTKDNTGLKLNIALNYGGRAELARAARILAQKTLDGEIMPAAIDEDAFAAELYAADSPDVDLLIRTSGEQRISNFLPWQLSYAEFIFDKVLWPDFTREKYMECLREYANRDRRFGAREEPEEVPEAPAPEPAEEKPAVEEPAEPEPGEEAPVEEAPIEDSIVLEPIDEEPSDAQAEEEESIVLEPIEDDWDEDDSDDPEENIVLNITPVIFPREKDETNTDDGE